MNIVTYKKCISHFCKLTGISAALCFAAPVIAEQDISVPKVDGGEFVTEPQAAPMQVPNLPALKSLPSQQVVPGNQNVMPILPMGTQQKGAVPGHGVVMPGGGMMPGQGGMMHGGQRSLKDMLGSDDIEDIRGPISIMSPFMWLYGGIAILLVAIILWALVRFIKRPKTVVYRKPYEIAFEALQNIRQLMVKEKAREFSISVSNVVRAYIENRFNVISTTSTTDEFMEMVRNEKCGALKDHMILLHDFLEFCDLAKFAGCQLTVEQMNGMMDSAWNFVDETKMETSFDEADQSLTCSDDGEDVLDPEVIVEGGVK